MEIILGIIGIIVASVITYFFINDKKRVEKLVENKISQSKPNQVEMIQSKNNVVYVAKDKEEDNTTTFAQALKEAQERLRQHQQNCD